MVRAGLVLTALVAATLAAWPTTAQEDPPDVTFEGAIEVAQSTGPVPPGTQERTLRLGPGTIQITLTPEMDGILRTAVRDVKTSVVSSGFSFEEETSGETYYWPPLQVDGGRFAVRMPISVGSSAATGYLNIEGEINFPSELSGTLRHSSTGLVTASWTASGSISTPPAADDSSFDAFVDADGTVQVSLAEDGQSITASKRLARSA